MKKKNLIASIAASALVAGSAQAATIAGWDVSQYQPGGGFLSIDGETLTNTLDANYSALDPSGLGPDSGAFGTMYVNGAFGSSLVVPDGSGTEAILPVAGSLASNLASATSGTPTFDSLAALEFEDQHFAALLSMAVSAPLSVVFEADLTSVPQHAEGWSVSFGGKTLVTGAGSQVTIEYSFNGIDYTSAGAAVSLTNADVAFSRNLTPDDADHLFVRLGFTGLGTPTFDNVRIQASILPEPSTVVLLIAGLLGLARVGRRRA